MPIINLKRYVVMSFTKNILKQIHHTKVKEHIYFGVQVNYWPIQITHISYVECIRIPYF